MRLTSPTKISLPAIFNVSQKERAPCREIRSTAAPAGFKYLVTEMVCWATGGPQKYTGRSMKDSHQHLMITATEWEAFLDDLQQTLDKFAVPQAEQAEIKAIVASTRADIVV